MAWRIDEQVVRGEIDNRGRGRVVARLWLVGQTAPVELSLRGNGWRDVAGRKLEFVNPRPQKGEGPSLALRQEGVIGDYTASRKVKVPEVSAEELLELCQQKKPFPWHWGNCLYFEWYSEVNGRVVLETASFQLTVSDVAAWEMTAEEEQEQREENSRAALDFIKQLGDAFSAARPLIDSLEGLDGETREEGTGHEAAESVVERPMTEAEAEALQAETDRFIDRVQARLDREGAAADYEKILAEELERRQRERGDRPLTPEQADEEAAWLDEVERLSSGDAAGDEAASPAELFRSRHPLGEAALELASRIFREPEANGWIPDGASREHPVLELINDITSGSVKLASALGGEVWPPDPAVCATRIVRLKRARGYLADALAAAADCREQRLVAAEWLQGVITEVEHLAYGCDELIGQLRSRLDAAQ